VTVAANGRNELSATERRETMDDEAQMDALHEELDHTEARVEVLEAAIRAHRDAHVVGDWMPVENCDRRLWELVRDVLTLVGAHRSSSDIVSPPARTVRFTAPRNGRRPSWSGGTLRSTTRSSPDRWTD
jgi:hypothetical protein